MICHERSVNILYSFVREIVPLGLNRAIDVAGGDARLTTSIVFKSYLHVDLFDQCPNAVVLAKKAMAEAKLFGDVFHATMQ